MNIDTELLEHVEEELDRYHDRFGQFFGRLEPRMQSRKYLQGLLGAPDRRNGWELAETVGDAVPDPTQRLLYRSNWDVDGVRDTHIKFVAEEIGTRDGIFKMDETGFLKSGNCSAGVQRQYTGTAGKITNCQIGVFLGYGSGNGDMLLDGRLYMPKCWCDDLKRREKAQVPETLTFATKPLQGLEMLKHAVTDLKVPGRWVVGDEVYGNPAYFRRGVADLHLNYVLAVSSTTLVGKLVVSESRGRPIFSFWPFDQSLDVVTIARNLPSRYWKRIDTSAGERGPIRYDWGMVRIGLPEGGEGWLLIRRSIHDPEDMAFYLSNAGPRVTIKTLARVALSRFGIEQCFAEAKTEAGLDEYECRLWPAWYRHMTLAIMAHAFLVATKKTLKQTDLREYIARARCRPLCSATPSRHRKRLLLHGLDHIQNPKASHGLGKSVQGPLLPGVAT
jgi:SRSO17 transposase